MNYEFTPQPIGRLIFTDPKALEMARDIARRDPVLAQGVIIVDATNASPSTPVDRKPNT